MTAHPPRADSRLSDAFTFTPEHEAKAQALISQYPPGRQASAILGLLDLAQRQSGGWLPHPALAAVARRLDMPLMRVYEIATFYTMFNLTPVGTYHLQVCTTTPCWLRGSAAILEACQRKLGVSAGETTPDGCFTLSEVECLGACINAPLMQVNDDYHENLTPDALASLLDRLQAKAKDARPDAKKKSAPSSPRRKKE